MGSGVAEVGQYTVAEIFSDVTIEASHGLRNRLLIRRDDLAVIFRVELLRERG